MKNNINVFYVIPTAVKEKLDLIGFDKNDYNLAKKLLFKLIKDISQNNYDIFQFNEIPSSYLRKSIGRNYWFITEKLELFGILQSSSYSTLQAKCKGYRIYPELMEKEEYSSMSFINKKEQDNLETDNSIILNPTHYINLSNNSTTSINNTTSTIAYMLRKIEKSVIKDDLKALYYNTEALRKEANDKIASICCAKFQEAKPEDNTSFKVSNRTTGYSYMTTFEKASKYCFEKGYTLFMDGKDVIIDDLDKYVSFKKKALLLHYRNVNAKLAKEIFYATRNDTNTRLDHNLTSMCSKSVKIIKKDNNLLELDINNSQFAIHSNWLKQLGLTDKYEDVNLYYNLSTTGTLYLTIAYMLRICSKADNIAIKEKAKKKVKGMMFNICFSSHKSWSKAKDDFKKLFPNVLNHIYEFKKEFGSEEFANELSRREAKMFIDNVYPNLKINNIWCLTKHDSIIFKAEDKEKVNTIVNMYFMAIDFKCTVSIEGENEPVLDTVIENVVDNKPEVFEEPEQAENKQEINYDGVYTDEQIWEIINEEFKNCHQRIKNMKFYELKAQLNENDNI